MWRSVISLVWVSDYFLLADSYITSSIIHFGDLWNGRELVFIFCRLMSGCEWCRVWVRRSRLLGSLSGILSATLSYLGKYWRSLRGASVCARGLLPFLIPFIYSPSLVIHSFRESNLFLSRSLGRLFGCCNVYVCTNLCGSFRCWLLV